VAQDLSPKARRALYKMEHTQAGEICQVVEAEYLAEGRGNEFIDWRTWFLGWAFPSGEFVPQSKLPANCRYESGPAYPDPAPLVL
jgi:hypothetical protein